MPDDPKPNVFAPEFLEQACEREPPPITGPEAALAGPSKVEPQGGSFLVVRESGGDPVAVTEHRETALLLAAVLPVAGRDPLYWIERPDPGKITLKTARPERAGRIRAIAGARAEPGISARGRGDFGANAAWWVHYPLDID